LRTHNPVQPYTFGSWLPQLSLLLLLLLLLL
jgi:hypothetical protein